MFFSREVTSTNSVCSILPAVLFETALFGIFTLLVAISTWILIRKGFNSLSTKAMLAATLVMYAAATVHWASQLDLFLILQKDAQLVQMICDDIFFFSSSGGSTVSTVFHQCAPSAMLSVNIILSDTIVLWRAWILRSGRALRTLSILLLLGTIGTSALDTALNRASANVLFGQSFNENPMGIFVFPFSWTTNIYAASVIGYKAWQHRRRIRDHLQHGNARTRAEKVMALFVESGLVYCSLWAFLTANAVIQVFALIPNSQSGARLITAGNVFVDGGLIQLIGIYPTIVIILVSLDMAH
ncbi:hypothetical protein OF83DRAFT_1171005 [Amylostereum chailletii]|nr:hypothetical protein OF83DRAFT_1171005 [Amylostereum chailletii]